MSAMQPPLVANIIYSMSTGGLENGLVSIINRCPPERYRHVIICITSADDFSKRLTVPGVEIIELRKRPGHDMRMYWRLWRVLRRLSPAIIHTRNIAALETHLLAFVMPGVKRVHGDHGRDIFDLDGRNRKHLMLRKILRPVIHEYVAISRDLADWMSSIIGLPKKRINLIYDGVDQQRFHPIVGPAYDFLPDAFLPSGKFTILGSVGRLAEVKNQKCIFEAIDILVKSQPALRNELRLILVGDGPLDRILRDRVTAMGLDDMVWMPGDRSDIPLLLQCMDIFLLPSLYEGISNTILEAMACGLPVVTTDVGGNAELVRDGINGYLVPANDPLTLANAMSILIDSPEQRESMGINAVARIKRDFDWERTVANYLALYDRLLEAVP